MLQVGRNVHSYTCRLHNCRCQHIGGKLKRGVSREDDSVGEPGSGWVLLTISGWDAEGNGNIWSEVRIIVDGKDKKDIGDGEKVWETELVEKRYGCEIKSCELALMNGLG